MVLAMSKFPSSECKLEDEYEPPFQSLGACLGFWNNYNPARQKFRNLAEPEGSPRPPTEDFGAVFYNKPPSPRDLWSTISIIVGKTLKHYRDFEVQGWNLRNQAPREWTHRVPAVDDIAAMQGIHPKKVQRYLRRINEDLVRQLKARCVLSQNFDF